MRLIDEQYLRTPFHGSRRMAAWLGRRGELVNRKRARRLMALMGLGAEQRRMTPRRKAVEKRGALSDHQRLIRRCGVTPLIYQYGET
jgi:hypothetical protein